MLLKLLLLTLVSISCGGIEVLGCYSADALLLHQQRIPTCQVYSGFGILFLFVTLFSTCYTLLGCGMSFVSLFYAAPYQGGLVLWRMSLVLAPPYI